MGEHDWRPCDPAGGTPPQRDTTANIVWPWRCATCWAYAETPAKGNIVLRRRSRPKAADRERWGVAATCEEQAVAEVHAL